VAGAGEQVLPEALDVSDPVNNTLILQKIADMSIVSMLGLSSVPHSLRAILLNEFLCASPSGRATASKVRAHNFWQGNATVGTQQAHKKMTGNEFVQRPWQFGAPAKGQVFESVPGFSHKVRTIYKKVGPDGQARAARSSFWE
jgi:hypothetical protein